MRNIIIRFLFSVILAGLTITCEACRFTVREIGFSVLSQTNYTLVIADGQLTLDHPTVQEIKRASKKSNIRLQLLHPEEDANHPLLEKAKAQGLVFPNAFLVGPEEWMSPIAITEKYSLQAVKRTFFNAVLQSPLRRRLLDEVGHTFACVISIPGKDSQQNSTVNAIIKQACMNVKDIMPLMPKEVKNPPYMLQMTEKDLSPERFLLWSLGFSELPEQPHAVVLYGRGRFMGAPLSTEQIQEGLVYKYLAMIGADCECNLDRKWMLGTQIPLFWDQEIRQSLADVLTFDVDNPSILAEMSRILAKETIGDNAATISYAPESIDLDEAFGNLNAEKKKEASVTLDDAEDNTVITMLFVTLIVLLLVMVIVSVIIVKKKR